MKRNATRVGLVFGYGLDYYRDILRGIKAFAEARPHWIFTPIAPSRGPCVRCGRCATTG